MRASSPRVSSRHLDGRLVSERRTHSTATGHSHRRERLQMPDVASLKRHENPTIYLAAGTKHFSETLRLRRIRRLSSHRAPAEFSHRTPLGPCSSRGVRRAMNQASAAANKKRPDRLDSSSGCIRQTNAVLWSYSRLGDLVVSRTKSSLVAPFLMKLHVQH